MAWDFWKKLTGKGKGAEVPPAQRPPQAGVEAPAATDAEAPAEDEGGLLATLKGFRGGMGQLMKLARDPKFRKEAEALVERMQKDGVDVSKKKAVEAWIEAHRAEFAAPAEGKVETFVSAEPAVGRNEPCSCGSGKKFKKCHGQTAAA